MTPEEMVRCGEFLRALQKATDTTGVFLEGQDMVSLLFLNKEKRCVYTYSDASGITTRLEAKKAEANDFTRIFNKC